MRISKLLFLLLLLPAFAAVSAQKPPKRITISGIVTDAGQKPVPGVIILVDNKKTESYTDGKGFYKVRVKADASVISVFSMQHGMIDEKISGRSEINFIFGSKDARPANDQARGKGNENINVGYGTMKKSEMTTTVGKIDAQNPKYSSYSNIYDMIRGEVPGVQVTGKTITIQGPQSINLSNEPLFVVDGIVVTTIDDIKPQMVKSIEILKGPSASIYGSRGTNGVILITLIGAEKRK